MTPAQRHITHVTQDIPIRFLKPESEYNLRSNVLQIIESWAERNGVTLNPEDELNNYLKNKEMK